MSAATQGHCGEQWGRQTGLRGCSRYRCVAWTRVAPWSPVDRPCRHGRASAGYRGPRYLWSRTTPCRPRTVGPDPKRCFATAQGARHAVARRAQLLRPAPTCPRSPPPASCRAPKRGPEPSSPRPASRRSSGTARESGVSWLPGVGDEQISLAPDRLDALRSLRFAPQFAPQPRDAYVQHAIDPVILAPVEMAKQSLSRLNLTRVRGEMCEQVELTAAQGNGDAVQADRVGGGIDDEPTEAQHRDCGRGVAPGPAQESSNPCQQHTRLDGLDDIVVCPKLQAEHVVDIVVTGGQDQYRLGV